MAASVVSFCKGESAVRHPVILVGDLCRVCEALSFDAAIEEGGPQFLNVIDTPVVESPLIEPQITLMNLLCQVRVGNVD